MEFCWNQSHHNNHCLQRAGILHDLLPEACQGWSGEAIKTLRKSWTTSPSELSLAMLLVKVCSELEVVSSVFEAFGVTFTLNLHYNWVIKSFGVWNVTGLAELLFEIISNRIPNPANPNCPSGIQLKSDDHLKEPCIIFLYIQQASQACVAACRTTSTVGPHQMGLAWRQYGIHFNLVDWASLVRLENLLKTRIHKRGKDWRWYARSIMLWSAALEVSKPLLR